MLPICVEACARVNAWLVQRAAYGGEKKMEQLYLLKKRIEKLLQEAAKITPDLISTEYEVAKSTNP